MNWGDPVTVGARAVYVTYIPSIFSPNQHVLYPCNYLALYLYSTKIIHSIII